MRMEILERDGMAIPLREITTASYVKWRPSRRKVAWRPSARRSRVQQRRQPESGRPPPPKQVLKLHLGRPRQPATACARSRTKADVWSRRRCGQSFGTSRWS